MSQSHETGFRKYTSLVTNHFCNTAIWTFAELGIADLLAASNQPLTADELAKQQGWNSEYLYRLLRFVADVDIVRELESIETNEPEKTNHFELTEDGRFLTSDHPSKARNLICFQMCPIIQKADHYLPQLIRDGPSKGSGLQQIIGNQLLFDFLKKEENHNLAHNFNETMTSISTYTGQAIVNTINFGQFNTIVDIGGSLGTLLSNILEKYPTIKHGICFDLPNVIEQAIAGREFEKRKISKDRYQFIGGDMFDAKTIPQSDAYIMQSIIHDWDDDRCIDILKAIRIASNGHHITLFIIGFILLPPTDQNKITNYMAHAADINMMISLNAKERTKKQHEYLFEQAGFTFKQLYCTESEMSIIEATAN
jgi:hypothetical protein